MDEVIIDTEEFLERVQDDKELLFELFDIFLEDFVEKREALTVAVEGKDYDQVRGIGHSLKGASGNISAKALRGFCIELEEMGKNKNLDGAEGVLKNLDQAFENLTARIEEVKKELGE